MRERPFSLSFFVSLFLFLSSLSGSLALRRSSQKDPFFRSVQFLTHETGKWKYICPDRQEKNMSKQFVAVNSKDLVVRKEYYDIPYENGVQTVLEFIGFDSECDPMFRYVYGVDGYPRDEEERCRFFCSEIFYKEAE